MGSNLGRRTVVVAASAGGIEALQALLSRLPADFPSPMLIILHVPATGGRALPRIMNRAGRLRAGAAVDGEELRPGRLYIAPPDRHMLVVGDQVRLSAGPPQHGHRPAADPLFRSAALAQGPRVIGVVLSGTLDDGAVGCAAIERHGGLVAIQDPAESPYTGMPRAALAVTTRAAVLKIRQIAQFLDEQCRIPVEPVTQPADPELERYVAVLLNPPPAAGAATGLTCPDCGGPLRSDKHGAAPLSYECGFGHSWSPARLSGERSAAVERARSSATLRLEERWRLTRELAESAERRGYRVSAATFRKAADQARDAAQASRASQAPPPSTENADNAKNTDIAKNTDNARSTNNTDNADNVGAKGTTGNAEHTDDAENA
jgi:two-component system, chemotaxis family, protein-glutamate methylesterase/glutaminase